MRRKDREVTDLTQITSIMNQCDSCRLGLVDNGIPYIVPLCFGYDVQDGQVTLYFHSAGEGRKLDIIQQNKTAAFEMDSAHALFGQDGPSACHFGMRFQSVMGNGSVHILENAEEKLHAFDRIMAHYAESWPAYNPQYLEAATIIAFTVESISCKVNKA